MTGGLCPFALLPLIMCFLSSRIGGEKVLLLSASAWGFLTVLTPLLTHITSAHLVFMTSSRFLMGLLQGETPVLSVSVCLSVQGLPCTEAHVQHIQMQILWFAVHEPFPWVSEQFSASKLPPHPELPWEKTVAFLEKVTDKSFPCRNQLCQTGAAGFTNHLWSCLVFHIFKLQSSRRKFALARTFG